jgi:hypothetical protein
MLDAVAYGAMPKNKPLVAAERAQVLESLIAATFAPDAVAAARDYYLGRMTALPAYRPEVIFSMIHQQAHAEGSGDWRMMESSTRSNNQEATPGIVIESGLEAIEACASHRTSRAEIDDRIATALRLENVAVDRH